MRRGALWTIVLLVLLIFRPAFAQVSSSSTPRLCLDELTRGRPFCPVPVGCQVFDCRRPPPPSLSDVIEIRNNATGHNTIVWLDGRRSSCVNDEVWRGPGAIPVGNVLSNGSCRSEVAVFSNGSAMQLIEGVTAW